MGQLFSDNARALLQSAINAVATSLTVEAGKADRFRVATTASWGAVADWFKIVVIDPATGNREVMKVGVRAGGSGVMSNPLRAQDGTTAQSFGVNALVTCAPMAADFENVLAGTFVGNVTAGGNLTVTGSAAIGGDLTVTGNQTVTGNLTVSGGLVVAGAASTTPKAVAFSATPSFDARESNVFRLGLMTASVTVPVITNPTDGQPLQVRAKQDATGGRLFAAGANWKVSGAIETGANRVSHLNVVYCLADDVWEGGWTTVAP